MSILVLAVTVAMASVLLWAGLEKARSLPSFVATVRRLGVPGRGARSAATLLVALELSVGLGLTFRPGSLVTLAGVMSLASAFAFAGLVALRRKERIECHCLGPHGARLGKRQLVAFWLWLGGVILLRLNESALAVDLQGASLLPVVALTMATLRAVSTLHAARAARGDRRSAQEMLVWLNR